MKQHTKGPWVLTDDAYYIVAMENEESTSKPPKTIACSPSPWLWSMEDARLLATAPELLEACKKAALMYESSGLTKNDEYKNLCSVIAKAGGIETLPIFRIPNQRKGG